MAKFRIVRSTYFIDADTNKEIVEQLNLGSFFGYKGKLEDFMESTAEACKLLNEAEIRTENYDIFVEDLLTNKFLILENSEDITCGLTH